MRASWSPTGSRPARFTLLNARFRTVDGTNGTSAVLPEHERRADAPGRELAFP